MTDDELRIRVAELCGYRRMPWSENCWRRPDGFESNLPDILPDYPNDLNAMHEAEKLLSDITLDDQWSRYCDALNRICCRVKCGGLNRLCGFTIHATARQRAEAFVATLAN